MSKRRKIDWLAEHALSQAAGEWPAKAAARIGVSQAVLDRAFKRLGLSLPPADQSGWWKAELEKAARDSLTPEQLAERLGRSVHEIRKNSNRYGISLTTTCAMCAAPMPDFYNHRYCSAACRRRANALIVSRRRASRPITDQDRAANRDYRRFVRSTQSLQEAARARRNQAEWKRRKRIEDPEFAERERESVRARRADPKKWAAEVKQMRMRRQQLHIEAMQRDLAKLTGLMTDE